SGARVELFCLREVGGGGRIVDAVRERLVVVLREPRVDAVRPAVVRARRPGLLRVEDLRLPAIVAHDGPVAGGAPVAERDAEDANRRRLAPGSPVVRLTAVVAGSAERAGTLAEGGAGAGTHNQLLCA